MPLPATLAPLRHRSFMLLSISSLVTFFGTHIQTVGASWEMMSLTSSATLVSLVQSASTLPALLFALVAGALADMFDRRHVLMTAQVVMMLAGCTLVISQTAGWMSPWLLLGLTFLLNIGTALRMPVQSALANDLVEPSEVPAAVALTGIGANLGRSLGPGIGGLLVAVAGVQAAFLANVSCVAAAFASTMTWRAPAHGGEPRHTHIGRAMLEGLRFCYTERAVRVLQIRVFCWVFCGVGIWALMPIIAKHHLGGGPMTLGVMLACQGVGAVIGAAALPGMFERVGVERLMRLGTVCFGSLIIAVALTQSLVLLMPTVLVAAIAWITYMTVPSTAMQMIAPRAIRGRVVATNFMVLYSGFGLGSWVWGMVADATSVRTSLLCAGAGVLANLLLAFLLPYRPPENPAS